MKPVSKKSTRTTGQALVEYVLVLGILTVVLAALAPLLQGAVTAVQVRFLAGAVGLP